VSEKTAVHFSVNSTHQQIGLKEVQLPTEIDAEAGASVPQGKVKDERILLAYFCIFWHLFKRRGSEYYVSSPNIQPLFHATQKSGYLGLNSRRCGTIIFSLQQHINRFMPLRSTYEN